MSMDFSLLVSADNTARKAAEANFHALRESQPQIVATQLVASFSQPCDPAVRELCAVLCRRYLPAMYRGLTHHQFSAEVREHVKAGLLNALSAEHTSSLRHKLCSVVGRLGAEFLPENSWPELNNFVQQACSSGVPTVHESALTVLGQMAPALVEPESWAKSGSPVQAIVLDGVAPERAPAVQNAALSALGALLRASAANEKEAEAELLKASDDKARKAAKSARKAYKTIATGLGEALPAALGVLEAALTNDHQSATAAIENLTEVAESQPRLFKTVLPQVVEGMASLALSLPQVEQRICAAELLLTLAEAQPKMCLKLPQFVPKVLSTLMALLVRLGDDSSEWEEAQPADGLYEEDGCEEDKEAEYAAEALDRLCAAIDGHGVVELLLPQLQALVGGGAWQQRHAALVAVGTVCETCKAGLEPHVPSLLGLLSSCAAAPEPRVRWAALYCLGLLSDEFDHIATEHHATAVPLVLQGIGDGCARVQAAAGLAVYNLAPQMERATLEGHQQALLGALHARLGAAPPAYVAHAVTSALSALFGELGASVAPTYATFLPMLRQQFEAALNAKAFHLAGTSVGAIGALAAAVGAAHFGADADGVVAPLVQLLVHHRAMLCEASLLEPLHASLAKMAEAMGAAFQPHMAQLLPLLLEAAAVEVEVEVTTVEEEGPAEDEDSNYETSYMDQKGCGFVKVRINSTQMQEKVVAVCALHEYAAALGGAFVPFVQAAVAAAGTLVSYAYNPDVRANAAMVLTDCIKAVVAAAKTGAGGVGAADGAALVGTLLKPLSEALHKEKELAPADAMLGVFRETLELQRTAATPLLSPPQVNGVIELLKQQLHHDAKRMEARADAAADDEEGDGGADEEELELEWEILLTVVHMVRELLRQHGAQVVPTLEAQLLGALPLWLGADESHRAAALYVFADLIEFGGPECAKKYAAAALPPLQQAAELAEGNEGKLVEAAASGLGAAAQCAGKLLTKGGAAEAARKLAAIAQAADARSHAERTEAAVLSIGKLLQYRMAHLEAAGLAQGLVPLFLGGLPLRHAEAEEQQAALRCLCALLEGEAAQKVLGGDGANLPQVLSVMGHTSGKESTGAEVSALMQRLVLGWQTSNPALLQASAGGLPQPVQQSLGRLMGSA